jgi:hypothetical protein
MRTVILIIGIVLTTATVLAMIQSMLMPRASRSIVAHAITRVVGAILRSPVRLLRTYRAQDRWLAFAPPVAILLELAAYVSVLIVTLGLVVYGATDLELGQAFYQSGSTLTTLGIVEPVNVPSAITVYIAAFLGLVVIAVFIGYLMALSSAYADRESPMVRIASLAGEPAWGPMILLRAQRIGMPLSAAPDANDWIDWASTTRMNEQISPALALLRSTSHRRHWVVTLLAVLDATALRSVITTEPPAPDDIQLLAVGAIALDVLAHAPQDSDGTTNWSLEEQVLEALHLPLEQLPEPTPAAVGVAAGDVAAAIDGLRRSGIAIANDENVIWRRFAALRATYYAPAADLARRLQAVPAPWSGARDPDNPVLWPERSDLLGGGEHR